MAPGVVVVVGVTPVVVSEDRSAFAPLVCDFVALASAFAIFASVFAGFAEVVVVFVVFGAFA